MVWEKVAHLTEVETGAFVDWDEEFFICPECGEPIYKCDWQDEDYLLGRRSGDKFYCPVCEEVIVGLSDDDEEDEE